MPTSLIQSKVKQGKIIGTVEGNLKDLKISLDVASKKIDLKHEIDLVVRSLNAIKEFNKIELQVLSGKIRESREILERLNKL